jgi:hypothetical protein
MINRPDHAARGKAALGAIFDNMMAEIKAAPFDDAARLRRVESHNRELLAALQKLIGAIDRLPGNNPLDGLADEARAAIARATGKE